MAATRAEAAECVRQNYANRLDGRALPLMYKVLAHPSVGRRFFAVQSLQDLIDEDPDRRVTRFTDWGVRLAAEPVERALASAGLGKEDVSALAHFIAHAAERVRAIEAAKAPE